MFLGHKGLSRKAIVLLVAIVSVVGVFLVFGQFIEQSRATETENIINLAVAAQERQLMHKGKYVMNWQALDVAPIAPHMKKVGKYVSSDGKIYLTNGKGDFATPAGGFKMYFEEKDNTYYLVAERYNWRYNYTFVRPIKSNKTICVPSTGPKAAADKSFCAEFMALEKKDNFPPDPRTIEKEVSPYW